jgi:hypothetical protein
MKTFVLPIIFLASSCSFVDYSGIDKGVFRGSAIVVWAGPGSSSSGDGRFLYVPVAGRELKFTRPESSNASGDSGTIQPEAFYTDGGSIPRSLQALSGFNAWGYGPAYVIHDWLFIARKCLNDENNDNITDEMRKIEEITFRESAIVLGETIRTLVDQYDIGTGDEFSGPIITSVTAGPISHKLWSEKGKCENNQVTDKYHLQIIKDLGRRQDIETLNSARSLPLGTQLKAAGGQPYQIVGTYNFGNP